MHRQKPAPPCPPSRLILPHASSTRSTRELGSVQGYIRYVAMRVPECYNYTDEDVPT
jgi:hypothetical protein